MANARKYDSLWLKQLYNSELFEEVYGFVGEEDYSPVPYEELSTEVLKERLKDLNARTPFHVEYNPSLESVIKPQMITVSVLACTVSTRWLKWFCYQ